MSSSQLLIASVRSEIYNSSLKKTNKVSIIIIIIAIINIIINFIFLGNDKYWMDGWWSVETDALRVAEKNISQALWSKVSGPLMVKRPLVRRQHDWTVLVATWRSPTKFHCICNAFRMPFSKDKHL